MRAPLLLMACVLLLLGGATGIGWLGDEPAPPPAAGAAADAAAAPGAAVAVEGSTRREAPAPAVAGAGATGAGGDDEADDEELAREAVPLAARAAPRVRVVRGEPPVPVADAEVFFVTEADAAQRMTARRLQLSRWEQPEELGQRMRTDQDGIALLLRAEAPFLCAAVQGGDFGVAVVPPRNRVHTIVLQPDETLSLRTMTDAEHPAPGIPVAVLQRFGDEEARTPWRGTSGADGRVRLRHFQLVREQRAADAREAFAAVAQVPTATPVPFVGRPATADEVVVPVPPLGRIAVQVVDHRGNPVLSPGVVGLAGDRGPSTNPNARDFAVPRGLLQQRRDKPLGSELVLLPFSELRSDLRLWARFANDRRAAEVGPVRGPEQPGEQVTVSVPLAPQQALLAGRFVGPDGAPLAARELTLQAALWRTDRDVLATGVFALADGRFDLVLPQRTDAEQFQLELRLDPGQLPPAAEGAPAPRLGARVRVPAIRGGQRLELGDIVLTELPPLVTGTVLDDAGQPVANADVQVQQQEPPQQGRDPRDGWRGLPLLRTRSGDDGTFVVDGMLPPGVLRVRADTDQHFADSVPLGSQGQVVRIVIQRNGILRGRVLLPDWIGDGALSLQLRPCDETLRERETRTVALSRRGGGRFTVEPLRPGRFDALVLLRNVPEPVAVLPDVFVQAGECRDVRFRPLDLRSALYRYRLRAVDAAGQPLAVDGPILARLVGNDGKAAESAFRWQRGNAELITASPSADLTFFGRGHRTTRLVLGPGEHDVLLATLLPVRIELPGLRGLCGPQRKVRISAILQGETGLPANLGGQDQRSGDRFQFNRWDLGRSSGGWLGATDTVEIALMQSGKYELLLRPHATDTERSPQGQVGLGTFELDVENGHWQPVRVPLDQLAILQALQQLDQSFAQAQAQGAETQRGQGRNRGR